MGEYAEDGTGRGTPLVPVQQAYSIMPMNSGKDYKARETDVAQPIMAGGPVGGNQGGDFIAIQERAVSENIDAGPQGKGWQENTAYTLEARNKVQAVAYAFKAGQGAKAQGIGWQEECAPTLSAGESGTQRSPGLLQGSAVRRLTPRECERLQGFPDDYTQIPWRGKAPEDCPDGPRYKALGNSMAVPVMRWIGERIKQCS